MPALPLLTFPRVLLCLAGLLLGAQAFAAVPAKEKFELGPWERDIGYAQAVKVGNTVYISGCVGKGDMEQALRQAYGALKRSLEHYRLSFANVVKENVYTTDIEALKRAAGVRKAYYGTDFPAATWVQVQRLYESDDVVEVELVAVVGP